MKNRKMNSLDQFEAELEAMNNEEMRGVIGGYGGGSYGGPPSYSMVVYGSAPSSPSFNYVDTSSYSSAFSPSSYPSAPTGGSGGSGGSGGTSSAQAQECKDQLKEDVDYAKDTGGLATSALTLGGVALGGYGAIAGAAAGVSFTGYMLSRANSNYDSCMGN